MTISTRGPSAPSSLPISSASPSCETTSGASVSTSSVHRVWRGCACASSHAPAIATAITNATIFGRAMSAPDLELADVDDLRRDRAPICVERRFPARGADRPSARIAEARMGLRQALDTADAAVREDLHAELGGAGDPRAASLDGIVPFELRIETGRTRTPRERRDRDDL